MATRLTSDERREHLLHVGVELIGRHGTADVSIEEIARAAGVSKGLLYHYFPTKTDFFVAAFARSQAEMDQTQVRDPELTPLEQFDRDLGGFLDFVEAHAEGYLAVVNARGREPRLQELVDRRRQRRVDELVGLAAALEQAPRETVRTPLLEAAIHGWIGFTETVVTRWLEDGEIERDEVHALLHAALLQVLESPHVRSG